MSLGEKALIPTAGPGGRKPHAETRLDAGEAVRAIFAEKRALGAITLLALLAVTMWYRSRGLIWGIDTIFPLDIRQASNYFHIPDAGIGRPDPRKLPFILPVMALLRLWAALGLPYSPSVVQPLLVSGLLAISGMAVYMLVRTIFRRVDRLSAFGAALFYMFNLYSLTAIWGPFSNLIIHYSLLPLIVLIWLLALRTRSYWIATLAAITWLVAATPVYITSPIALTDSLLFLGLAFAEVLSAKRGIDRVRVVLCSVTIYGIWLTISLFWILPLALYADEVEARELQTGDPLELLRLNSVPLDKAVRLSGYWAVNQLYQGSPYYPWRSYYLEIGLIAAIAIPLIAVLAFAGRLLRLQQPVVSSNDRHYRSAFATVLVVAVIALTGSYFPFGSLKSSLLNDLGLVGPFRSVYTRFGVYAALAYAPLIALGLCTLSTSIRERVSGRLGLTLAKAASAAAIVCVGVLPALPLWTGSAFDASGAIPSHRIDIPPSYNELAASISRQPGNFTILAFPFARAGAATALTWQGGRAGYSGVEPFSLMVDKPSVTGDPAAPYIADLVQRVTWGGESTIQALRELNVGYVVIHTDANRRYLAGSDNWIGKDVEKVVTAIGGTGGLTRVQAGRGLIAFRVDTWLPFRVFAVRGYDGNSIYYMNPADIRPIPYRMTGDHGIHIDADILKKGELLVVNHPFDPRWRASGKTPVRVEPGLTGFAVDRREAVEIGHQLDRRFRLFLIALIGGVLAIATVLGVAAWRKDRPRHT